ncbi:agmatine deiminase family protein [Haliangium ochraceum]|uniref:Agmatine deiminase n=1 Tax=Haliangium ochraceum (strain DSM 14365 / JCM 11303 / SMP-2) TaxID=502025 RepID=D0LNZ7_HALO1|nr:agmatine deiminase family protein [Haliangium ochraceum]ACY18823.1 Agmatine deiminase [Haliangium ochraceum DSM 14365]
MHPPRPTSAESETSAALRWPAEWEAHAACWLAWPWDESEWGGDLVGPRRTVAAMAKAIADRDPRTGQRRGERVEMLVRSAEDAAELRALLGDDAYSTGDSAIARLHVLPFGDIWLRDTGPVFVELGGEQHAARFRWNGWGGKYDFPDDHQVGDRIAELVGASVQRADWILEGGGIEGDGAGTLITTRECLLAPTRNPELDRAAVEERLRAALGVRSIIWLDRGLANDHTDGHVDNLARFVAPGRVVCMRAADAGDPNREVLADIAATLRAARDAQGRALELIELPSPGRVDDKNGDPMPASYMNFYIGNSTVVVPVYGTAGDGPALDTLAELFPGRRVLGIDGRALLGGGGAFHCISREQPEVPQSSQSPRSPQSPQSVEESP